MDAFKIGNRKWIGRKKGGGDRSRCDVGLFFGHLDSQHLTYLVVHVPPHEQTHDKIFRLFAFVYLFRR